MRIGPGELPGLLMIEPDLFEDSRGFLFEVWNRRRYAEAGLEVEFVQDNLSRSRCGTLRGLHFQNPCPQGKLVSVLEGEVYDVVVDLRRSSLRFGSWTGVTLSSRHPRQVYIPPGLAHGFLVLSESALFHYKCTAFYSPNDELRLRWDDPELAIDWPIREPRLSAQDASAPRLRELPVDRLYA